MEHVNTRLLKPHVICFSADVFSRTVDEPLEPGGAGEARPRELPHPSATDYQQDQRGEKTKVTVAENTWNSVHVVWEVLLLR